MAAPGSPAAGGHMEGGHWPFKGPVPEDGRGSPTGQQTPSCGQDRARSSAHGCGSEGWDGVSKRGGTGDHRAGHSPQNGELMAQGWQPRAAMEEGPGPRRQDQGAGGYGRRLHLSCVAVQVGEKTNPDRVCTAAGSFQDPQVPDDFREAFPKTNAPEVNCEGSGIQESCKARHYEGMLSWEKPRAWARWSALWTCPSHSLSDLVCVPAPL